MTKIAFLFGLLAVATLLVSYAQKRRGPILLCSLLSRAFGITQYILLGAFEGALLDVCHAVSAFFAQRSDDRLIKRFKILILIAANLFTVASGIWLYRNPFSLLPMFAVLLQANALWLKNEKYIRLLSLAGCPLWFTFNLASDAYAACIGEGLAMVTLIVAIVKYDVLGKKKEKNA